MNKVFNDYGAMRHDNGVGGMVDTAVSECEKKLASIIAANQLTPIELRCLTSYVSNSFENFFAVETLRKGIAMRKAEREEKKRLQEKGLTV